jgi:hypothetical protein
MNDDDLTRICSAVERIALVLGAMYASHLGDVDQLIKTERLSRCGFSNSEIATLLGITTNAANVALHRARKGSRGPRAKKRKKK